MSGDTGRAVDRVVEALGTPDAVTVLADVSGSDLTSFLLKVMRGRATRVTPARLVRAVRTQRLVEPGRVDARVLHRTVASVLDSLPADFEVLELSPVAPLGTCSAVATVDQTKIVSAVRGLEVAADPTNTLAAIAASRRRDGDGTTLRLAAAQRVLRTQPMRGAGQSHFMLLGLAIAGRDQGNLGFERASLTHMLTAMVAAARAVTDASLEIRSTNLRDRFTAALVADVGGALADVSVVDDAGRTRGRGYYRDVCFKLVAGTADGAVEIGDGGFTDWTQQLTGSRKERLLVGGIGLDRLASLAS